MKSRSLKIILPLLGLFLAGASFGSPVNSVQAATTSCVTDYSNCTQFTTTTTYSCGSYSGSYACASWYNCSGGCGTTDVAYCCPSGTTQTCTAYGQTCTCTPSWPTATASCATYAGSYGIPAGYTVGTAYYTYNDCTNDPSSIQYLGYNCTPPPTCPAWSGTISSGACSYTGSVGSTAIGGGYSIPISAPTGAAGSWPWTCNNVNGVGTWTPGTAICTLPPTSANTFINVNPSSIPASNSFSADWGPSGSGYTYTISIGPYSIGPFSGMYNWSGTPASLGIPANTSPYSVTVNVCNGATCASGATSLTVTPPVPVINSFNASKTSLKAGGEPVTLTWSSSYTTSCSLSVGDTVIQSGLPITSNGYLISNVTAAETAYKLTCQ